MPTRRLPKPIPTAVLGTYARVSRAPGGLERPDLALLLWRIKPLYPPNRS